jgi:hypothetical protein
MVVGALIAMQPDVQKSIGARRGVRESDLEVKWQNAHQRASLVGAAAGYGQFSPRPERPLKLRLAQKHTRPPEQKYNNWQKPIWPFPGARHQFQFARKRARGQQIIEKWLRAITLKAGISNLLFVAG